jgi:hypothetical protein
MNSLAWYRYVELSMYEGGILESKLSARSSKRNYRYGDTSGRVLDTASIRVAGRTGPIRSDGSCRRPHHGFKREIYPSYALKESAQYYERAIELDAFSPIRWFR